MNASEKSQEKASSYLTKEEALEILEEKIKSHDENVITGTYNKIAEKVIGRFSADEFKKSVNSATERIEKLKKEILGEIQLHLRNTETELERIGDQIKSDTETYLKKEVNENLEDKRRSLYIKEKEINEKIKEERKKLYTKEEEIQKKEDRLRYDLAELNTEKEKLVSKEEKIEEDFKNLEEQMEDISTNREKLQAQIVKYKELKQTTDENIQKLEKRREELENLQGASSKMLDELVPNFISENDDLEGFFNKLSSSGKFEGQGLLLVAQLKMLDSFLETGEIRNLKSCLKEIGRSMLSYCYENNLDLEDIPRKLADTISSNGKIREMKIVLDIPYHQAQVDTSWMVDLTEGKGSQSVKRILTWAIRDSTKGTAISKAEIES